LLASYARVVNGRDIKGLLTVWPDILSKDIEAIKVMPKGDRISLTVATASLLPDNNEIAVVRCRQTLESNGKTQDDNVTFYLGRLHGGWIIDRIPSSN
jgi:hypothetical protein